MKRKLFLLLFGLLFFIMGIMSFTFEQSKPETILIKYTTAVIDRNNNSAYLFIYRGDGFTEKITLEKASSENEKNVVRVLDEVEKYQAMGFELVSHSETFHTWYTTSFVLSKK